MNNGFIVSIPKDLSLIKSKLFMGLTKRQLIGFGIGIVLGVPFFLVMSRVSVDLGMIGSFVIMAPFFVGTIYKKNRLYTDKWLKLMFASKFIYHNKRTLKSSKRNVQVIKSRGLKKNVRKKKPISNAETVLSQSQK